MPGPRLAAAALLPAVVLAAAGCASRRTVQDLQQRVDRLQIENFELRKQLAEARVLQESRPGEMQAVPLARAAAAPDDAGVPGPGAEALLPRVVYSEAITEPLPPPGTLTSGPSSVAARPRAPGGGGPEALLEAAKRSLDAGDPQAAAALFDRIVADHADHALADDAQLGIGEARFQMGRYEEAIAAYRKVAELFPFGDRVPFAFLKIAFAQLALEQRDQALDSFRTVSEAFPGTEAATIARQQIAHLTRP